MKLPRRGASTCLSGGAGRPGVKHMVMLAQQLWVHLVNFVFFCLFPSLGKLQASSGGHMHCRTTAGTQACKEGDQFSLGLMCNRNMNASGGCLANFTCSSSSVCADGLKMPTLAFVLACPDKTWFVLKPLVVVMCWPLVAGRRRNLSPCYSPAQGAAEHA